jgi:phage tail sheath protein FI
MADVLADPVVTKLKDVATRLNGIALADGPEDKTKQQDYAKANGAANLYILHPKAKATVGDAIVDVPLSAFAAGVLGTLKFWESPSNKVVRGIIGPSRPIAFALDDPRSEGQILNSYQVATLVRQDGFRIWGARGSGDPTDQKTNQLQKLRIRNAIKAKLISSHRWAVAQGITKKYFVTVTSSVNNFLALLQSEGAIAGGECYALEEKNPPSELFNGSAHFYYAFTPTPVAERLTFEEIVTDKYLSNIV